VRTVWLTSRPPPAAPAGLVSDSRSDLWRVEARRSGRRQVHDLTGGWPGPVLGSRAAPCQDPPSSALARGPRAAVNRIVTSQPGRRTSHPTSLQRPRAPPQTGADPTAGRRMEARKQNRVPPLLQELTAALAHGQSARHGLPGRRQTVRRRSRNRAVRDKTRPANARSERHSDPGLIPQPQRWIPP
jgi:hypothetical protein